MNAKPTTDSRFTVADLARANEVNPKIARRRLRDARRKAELTSKPAAPKPNTDGRLFWEFINRSQNTIESVILGAA
jgi:hypothetical protein